MKIQYIIIAIMFISCSQKIKQEKVAKTVPQEILINKNLSQEGLVNKALKALNLELSKTDFIVSKVSPSNPKETIIVIPEVVNEQEWSFELNSNIVIIDNTTGKITHKYFESSKENGWFSDAIFIYGIDIDTQNYKLNKSKNAFGVIVKFRSGSQPNPYNSKNVSLFVKEKNSLKKILDFYGIHEESGEVNINGCYSNIKKTVNELSMSDSMTNKQYDISVENTVTQVNHKEDENDNCNPKEKIISTKKQLLKFNGDVYELDEPIITKFTSNLKPNEPVLLDQIYTDTIVFSAYDDNGDYFMLLGKKNGNDVSLIYNWEWITNDKYNFKDGDTIKVKWKMQRIVNAGDEEIVTFRERAIDAEKIVSENKEVKFLWREDKFDQELNQEINSIFINEPFCSSISNQEKAALGYVATFIGNECWWDEEKPNENRSNLKCKILTALDLGYQCSDKHLGFLQSWFSKDIAALKQLERCSTMPYTATVQTTFDEITLFTDKDNKTITVNYKAYRINVRESSRKAWTQTDIFKYDLKNTTLISSKKSDLKEEN